MLPDQEAEAIKITLPEKEYILVVAHKAGDNLQTFLLVEDHVLSGEVILIEKALGTSKIHVLR